MPLRQRAELNTCRSFTCASRWSFGAGAFEGGPVSVVTGMENHNRMLGDQIRTELL